MTDQTGMSPARFGASSFGEEKAIRFERLAQIPVQITGLVELLPMLENSTSMQKRFALLRVDLAAVVKVAPQVDILNSIERVYY